MLADYQYILNVPDPIDEDDEYTLMGIVQKLLTPSLKTNTEGVETFALTSLKNIPKNREGESISVYGIQKDSKYVSAELFENGVTKIYHKALCADFFFMSTNAITADGELVNIDGNGNRLAALIYGPEHVIILAGMNKVVRNVDDAISRVKNIAAPANGVRLNTSTPCAITGICHDCFSPSCMCSHTVVTRRCSTPGRITVLLIGEELGY